MWLPRNFLFLLALVMISGKEIRGKDWSHFYSEPPQLSISILFCFQHFLMRLPTKIATLSMSTVDSCCQLLNNLNYNSFRIVTSILFPYGDQSVDIVFIRKFNFRFITWTKFRGDREVPQSGELWVPFMLFWRSLYIHFVWYLYNYSTSTVLTHKKCFCFFLVPFDPKIPAFTFLSLLGINTFRILTEKEDSVSSPSTRQSQGNNFILQSDPMCGLPAGGGGCDLDCDGFSDPTCLRDCPQYPACFQQLYGDFETAGRVVIIKH